MRLIIIVMCRGAISDFIIFEPYEYGIMYKVWMFVIILVNGVAVLVSTGWTFIAPFLYWKELFARCKRAKEKDTSG